MDDGTPIPRYLTDKGMLPGIKVDTGAKPLAGHTGETVTEGLDGLRKRCEEYYNMGARFAKWRAVISISENRPAQHQYQQTPMLLRDMPQYVKNRVLCP